MRVDSILLFSTDISRPNISRPGPILKRRRIILDLNQNPHPKVAIIMGDATGIGPEIVAKSLNTEETRQLCTPAVIGDSRVMAEAIKLAEVALKIVVRESWRDVTGEASLVEMFDLANLDPKDYKMGEVNAKAGKACLQYLDFAIAQAMDGQPTRSFSPR